MDSLASFCPTISCFPISYGYHHGTCENLRREFQFFLSKQSKSSMEKKMSFLSPCQAPCKIHKLKSQANSILYAQNLVTWCYKIPQIQACDLTSAYCGMSQGKWSHVYFHCILKGFFQSIRKHVTSRNTWFFFYKK